MTLLDGLHGGYVHPRRIQVLTKLLVGLVPPRARLLDVGAGDGQLAEQLVANRPDIDVRGIDVLVRRDTRIPVDWFDGLTIPHPDGSFDVVLFVDVLHHTKDPMVLLREATRVARRLIIIKDHLLQGTFAGVTLAFMDRVGNARHGVVLPNNYWRHQRWREAFDDLGLHVARWEDRLALYPGPANWIFGRSLHFVACLEPRPLA